MWKLDIRNRNLILKASMGAGTMQHQLTPRTPECALLWWADTSQWVRWLGLHSNLLLILGGGLPREDYVLEFHSSLLLRQDLSWRVAWKGSEPYPPECGSQLHHTLLGFLHYSHYKMRYFVCLLVYMTTAFFRRRRPCPSYSFLENGKRLEQNSHSVNIAK